MPAIYTVDGGARFMGVYSGNFGNDGIITLVLNYISGNTVSGYDVHKGLRRNVNGEMTRDGGKLNFVLKEPGDNRFDGTFSFSLDTTSRKIEGEWTLATGMTARVVRYKLTRLQWDENAEDNKWVHADTALSFRNNGTCQLEIMPPEVDYSKQRAVVQGNYDRRGDTFRIEWEKNPYIAETVKMVEFTKKGIGDGGDSSDRRFLRGGGMLFAIKGEPIE